jgi:hypothetical protein
MLEPKYSFKPFTSLKNLQLQEIATTIREATAFQER